MRYISIIISINLIFGAYFKNIPIFLTQPDGTNISCLASGDEFYHYLHDENNYTIIQNKIDRYYYYAERNNNTITPSNYLVGSVNPSDVEIKNKVLISKENYLERRDSFHNGIRSRGNAPSVGTVNNINIFIRFADEEEFTNSRSYYDDKFSNPDGPSMYHYYKEVSYDLLTVNTIHYPTLDSNINESYQDEYPRCYYAPCNEESDNCCGYLTEDEGWERGSLMLRNAIEYIADEVPEDLIIDSNDDDLIDNITFLVKGQPGAWADFLWPHRSTMSGQTFINGKKASAYNLNLADSPDYFTVGTLCHEFFHSIGAPDLYHYWDDVSPVAVGGWDVMDASSSTPQSMSAYMKYKYTDWIEELPILETSGIYQINPLSSTTNNIFRINSPLTDNEYFVLEYRVKEGLYEVNTPGNENGLIIYRVIDGLNGNANGPPDELYVYRQGGTPESSGTFAGAVFNHNIGRIDFNDNTDPSCFLYDGSEGGINIANVGLPEDTIQFEIINLTLIPELETLLFDSDDDGIINPGEEVSFDLSISNLSDIDADNIIATISSSNENIIIENNQIIFGQILAGNNINQSIIFNVGENVIGQVTIDVLLEGSFLENDQVINYNDNYYLYIDVTLNQNGFPYSTLNEVRTSPVISDLNQDGQYEIIFGDHFGNIHVINSNGEPVLEDTFPFDTDGQIWGSPAVADIDNDGYDDIIVTSKSKHLYILDRNGLKLDYDSGTQLIATPTIGNFDSDDELEIVFGGYSSNQNNLLLINSDGSDVFDSELYINEKNKSGFAIADFNDNDINDIVFGTDSDNLYLIYDDGTIADGFPFVAGDKFRLSPVIINYFGEMIIVAGSEDQHLHGLNKDGTVKFDITFDNQITTSPSVTKIENNIFLFIGFDNGDIKCIDLDGNILNEYSFNISSSVIGSITFSDLDSDGLIEVVSANESGEIFVFKTNGEFLQNFPITYEFPISSALTIFDVDNDNDLEIFAGTANSLLMLDIKTIGSLENNWNIYGGDNRRSSFYNIVCISGDLNLSETLDILDIILLVNEILEISEDEYLNCQVDLNNDDNINIFDLILLVYAILDE